MSDMVGMGGFGSPGALPCSVCSTKVHESLLIAVRPYKLCALSYERANDRSRVPLAGNKENILNDNSKNHQGSLTILHAFL